MKTSDAIWDIVGKFCDTVWFVPGGQAMHLVDSLGKSGLKHISCQHEQGAGFAAIGYAMARNSLGVVLTTSGPGATNAITPCYAAWADSVPILFVSGQSNLNLDEHLRVRGVQMVDIISLVRPITKIAERPCKPLAVLEYMIETCLSGRRGPAWIDITLATQAEEI